MSLIEISVSVTASVAVLWLAIAAVKTTNHRFRVIEKDIEKAKNRHIGCSVEVKTKLEAFEEIQKDHGARLSDVSENVAWLVKWAKNGGSSA